MERLRNATGETVQVAVLDGREVVYVERLDSPHTLRLFLDVGRRNWAHSTATGKCLLAYVSDYDLDRILDGWQLPAVTAETVTNHHKLRKQLLEVRRRGYAQNLNEAEMGVLSVAAPIRDRHGGVVAAMSVAGPAARMDPILGKIAAAVVESAALASRRLGYRR
jgi:IclR family acetate operon transcriptional repressor